MVAIGGSGVLSREQAAALFLPASKLIAAGLAGNLGNERRLHRSVLNGQMSAGAGLGPIERFRLQRGNSRRKGIGVFGLPRFRGRARFQIVDFLSRLLCLILLLVLALVTPSAEEGGE